MRIITLGLVQLLFLLLVGCMTTTHHSRGSIDLSKYKTVYVEMFKGDDYGFTNEVTDILTKSGLQSIEDKEKADLMLNWHYTKKKTNVSFIFEDKNGATVFLGLCDDPIEKGEQATWYCIERALSSLSE